MIDPILNSKYSNISQLCSYHRFAVSGSFQFSFIARVARIHCFFIPLKSVQRFILLLFLSWLKSIDSNLQLLFSFGLVSVWVLILIHWIRAYSISKKGLKHYFGWKIYFCMWNTLKYSLYTTMENHKLAFSSKIECHFEHHKMQETLINCFSWKNHSTTLRQGKTGKHECRVSCC